MPGMSTATTLRLPIVDPRKTGGIGASRVLTPVEINESGGSSARWRCLQVHRHPHPRLDAKGVSDGAWLKLGRGASALKKSGWGCLCFNYSTSLEEELAMGKLESHCDRKYVSFVMQLIAGRSLLRFLRDDRTQLGEGMGSHGFPWDKPPWQRQASSTKKRKMEGAQ